MTTKKERVIAWLNDAYGMETSLVEVLERHAKDAEGNTTVRTRIQRHVDETRTHADTVRGCIEQLGGTTSGGKEAVSKVFGAFQGMMNKPAEDTMVKNSLADYAAEHFEIASYRALISAARDIGEPEIANKLEGILRQEEDMALFLEQQLSDAVSSQLARDGS